MWCKQSIFLQTSYCTVSLTHLSGGACGRCSVSNTRNSQWMVWKHHLLGMLLMNATLVFACQASRAKAWRCPYHQRQLQGTCLWDQCDEIWQRIVALQVKEDIKHDPWSQWLVCVSQKKPQGYPNGHGWSMMKLTDSILCHLGYIRVHGESSPSISRYFLFRISISW